MTGRRVVALEAENVKRLRAVEVRPDPDDSLVIVSGRNGQGKSSVLDSLWLALGGGPAGKASPDVVRHGTDGARVRVDLGDLVVERKWNAEGRSTLTVTAADGARYSSPQQLLDSLVGRLSFDPLAFAGLKPKEQRAALLELVELPFDLDAFEAERADAFAERTEVGRLLKAAEVRLAAMPAPPPDLPTGEQSSADVVARMTEAEAARSRRRITEGALADRLTELDHRRALLAQAQRDVNTAEGLVALARKHVEELGPEPEPVDYAARLAEVEETNRAVRAAAKRDEEQRAVEQLRRSRDTFTAHLDELDAAKSQALAAATMPLAGLGFDDDGVTYNGVPLQQSSGAEQLRVSVAVAMALNPQVRVLRVTDGSLLDSDNLRLLAEYAAAEDFQVWVERVDESGTVGVVIDDGEVRA